MAFVIPTSTVSVALFRGAVISRIRAVFPYLQAINDAPLLGAGAYIVYYRLTVGGLLEAVT